MGGKALNLFIITVCLALGYGFAKFYQPYGKTIRIYQQAIKDYDNGNYSNSYYLFSKIGYSSNLKPIAIYRQALCAKALGDSKSELNSYKNLFRNYPTHKFASIAKYHAGRLIEQEYPNKAQKYFQSVLKSDLDEDYKIASGYYIAKIEALELKRGEHKISDKQKTEIENSFKKYLENAPNGRLASDVVKTWQKFNPKPQDSDKLLIARALYKTGQYNQADELLKELDDKQSWAIKALNNASVKKYSEVKNYVLNGVEKYSSSVIYDDMTTAIDAYLELFEGGTKSAAIKELNSKAQNPAKEYISYLECSNSAGTARYNCFKNLYQISHDGKYAQNALFEMFNYNIRQRNYADGKSIAKEFLTRFPSDENTPMVMFWAAKIDKMYENPQYTIYLNNIINKFPDSYYAYRAFWIMKGVRTAAINVRLNYKPVEYPYKFPPKGSVSYNLIRVKDYKMLSEFTNDKFIESWGEYQRGNYTTSLNIAKTAMDKLNPKPVKTDLRWRLVYPQNYFKQVQTNSRKQHNDDALIMSVIRTESSFNSEAQSSVGAMGLMQLMPSTAHEVGKKLGLDFNTNYLFNPELNIKLGNIYYSDLRKNFSNNDLYSVAAYNGGAGAVKGWQERLKYNDIDEFVEQVPYEETKNYIKKVFASYWNYVKIYQK